MAKGADASHRRFGSHATPSNPVGYLEGVSVREGYRQQGIARKLVSECEQWAREKGCTEFASDCELTNTASLSFHLGIGFREENRLNCFKNFVGKLSAASW
ncbi:MAG: GNAT family N-acetyltransferase [Clostridia bacterium]|nr:GNAT family N-acetyltransferase [Clostridia bacterium]